MKYKTVFISDLHLGGACNYSALHNFLRDTDANTWYLIGDVIDFWAIKRNKSWPNGASVIVQKLLRKAIKGQRIVILPGNHDSELRELNGFNFGNIEITETAVYTLGDKKYFILHGDVFDSVIAHAGWLSKIGAIAYDFLIELNGLVNFVRGLFNLPYWSFSASIKRMVKHAVSYVSDFEKSITDLAITEKTDGVICGHIHTPAEKILDGVEYFNSGDWVESLTALVVEENSNKIELIYYN